MTGIPKKYITSLSKQVEKLGKNETELQAELNAVFAEIKEMHPDAKDSVLWKQAWRRWRGMARREAGSLFSPAALWTGVIWGESGLVDFVDIMKRKAVYLYELGGTAKEKAIDDLIVSREGIPLDTRKKTNYGRDDNPNFARPFPEEETSYYRAVYGVATKGPELDESNLTFFRYNLNDSPAQDVNVPETGLGVQFRGNPKKKQEYGFMDINAPSTIGDGNFFRIVDDLVIPDLYEGLQATMWQVYSVDDLEMAYMTHKDDRSVPVVFFGSVASIGTEVNDKTGNRTLYVDDPDGDMDKPATPVFINGEMPIKFGLDSGVLFCGRIAKMGAGTDEEKLIVDASGYYAPPEYLFEAM